MERLHLPRAVGLCVCYLVLHYLADRAGLLCSHAAAFAVHSCIALLVCACLSHSLHLGHWPVRCRALSHFICIRRGWEGCFCWSQLKRRAKGRCDISDIGPV
ncbi:hypothetical protein BD769DRAFT_1432313 [Suillus cothurnatus]|nr:hypothetical protein BD769DRAFT_1432313 [Suillus cothurnatus]